MKPMRFSPEPYYSKSSDTITCLTADEAEYAERFDKNLTILRSAKDDRVIGYEIHGVSKLVDSMKS